MLFESTPINHSGTSPYIVVRVLLGVKQLDELLSIFASQETEKTL